MVHTFVRCLLFRWQRHDSVCELHLMLVHLIRYAMVRKCKEAMASRGIVQVLCNFLPTNWIIEF